MKTYDNLVEALNDLKARGYAIDFNLKADCIECSKTGPLKADQFEITEVYRFEGMTNPGDSSVLYVIEGQDGRKGTLVDAYGVYAEALSDELVQKLGRAPQARK